MTKQKPGSADKNERLLAALRGHTSVETAIGGKDLADRVNLDVPEIGWRIHQLKKAGHKIYCQRGKGYWLDAPASGGDKRQPDEKPAPQAPPAAPLRLPLYANRVCPQPDPTASVCRVTVSGLPALFDQAVSRPMAEAVIRLAFGLSSAEVIGEERRRI